MDSLAGKSPRPHPGPGMNQGAAVLGAVKGSAQGAPARRPPLTAPARDRRHVLGRDEERL